MPPAGIDREQLVGRPRTAGVWEALHELAVDAPADAVWALWDDPTRWADWNRDIERVTMVGPLERGAVARIKFRRSATLRFEVTAVEPGRSFTDETRLPLATMGHQHRVDPAGARSRVSNRVYLDGPAASLYALLLGRRIRASVVAFVERERELAQAATAAARP